MKMRRISYIGVLCLDLAIPSSSFAGMESAHFRIEGVMGYLF
jgi:hypothetical protein